MKKSVGCDMGTVSGSIKLLFATEAYSMGADAANVSRVFHITPPSNLESKILIIFLYIDSNSKI